MAHYMFVLRPTEKNFKSAQVECERINKFLMEDLK